jgi:hypothetical protein
MEKLIIYNEGLTTEKDAVLLNSFRGDVVSISENMFKQQTYADSYFQNLQYLGLLFHYEGNTHIPFFEDTNQDVDYIPTYTYFSNELIALLTRMKTIKQTYHPSSPPLVLDLITCNFNTNSFKNEADTISNVFGITIRYSIDETGNATSGNNWVLESHNVDIRPLYFTDNVLNWTGTLTNQINSIDLENLRLISDNSSFITKDQITEPGKTIYTLTKNIFWSDISGITPNTHFISLSANTIFDGNGHTIDLSGVSTHGLFSTAGDINTRSIVRHLGVIGGTIPNSNSSFIIRSAQSFFIVDSCYSTGAIISGNGGGICGRFAGSSGGSCIISNCYSTGNISSPSNSGGICGAYAGNSGGSCIIRNCYSSGIIQSSSSGGICSSYAGYGGSCIIENCYSLGNINGTNNGGITSTFTGSLSGGTLVSSCIIRNCYSKGYINGSAAGGICGNGTGDSENSTVIIDNCYSVGDISGVTGTGGICGALTSVNCTVTNCYSQRKV